MIPLWLIPLPPAGEAPAPMLRSRGAGVITVTPNHMKGPTMLHGIFISGPHLGRIFVAERSRKGSKKLRWSVMPEHQGADVLCEPSTVPYRIRRQAYRWMALGLLGLVLFAAPQARAGDHAILDCKARTLFVMSWDDAGVSFQRWRREKDGEWRGGKELPRRWFHVSESDRGGDRVYYRGKRCVELEQ